MTDLQEFLASSMGRHIWLSTLVFAVATVLCFLMKNTRARIRHRVWLLSLLFLISPVTYLQKQWGSPIPIPVTQESSTLTWLIAPGDAFAPNQPQGPAEIQDAITLGSFERPGSKSIPWLAIWAFGSLFMALALIKQCLGLMRMLARSKAAPKFVAKRLRALTKLNGGKKAPRLLVNESISTPLAAGLIRPTIVLPLSLTNRDSGDIGSEILDHVLLHELCHIRRRDIAVRWLVALAKVLWFFHPALWWISERLRSESELAVDEDITQRQGVETMQYARTLLTVAKNGIRHSLAIPLSEGARDLQKRIINLKRHKSRAIALEWVPLLMAFFVMALWTLSPAVAFIPGQDSTNLKSDDSVKPSEFARWLLTETKLVSIDIPETQGHTERLSRGRLGAVLFMGKEDALPRIKSVDMQSSEEDLPHPKNLILEEEIQDLKKLGYVDEDIVEVEEDAVIEEVEEVEAENTHGEVHIWRENGLFECRYNGSVAKPLSALVGHASGAESVTLYCVSHDVTIGEVASVLSLLAKPNRSVTMGGVEIGKDEKESLTQILKPYHSPKDDVWGGPEILLALDRSLPWSTMAKIMQVCGSPHVMNPRVSLAVRRSDGKVEKISMYLPADVGVGR